jgi:Zn finger protein HypA/HybF involved in hydrogenase expression
MNISVEKLAHFQCSDCNKWWTIKDAPEQANWFCPWCDFDHRRINARTVLAKIRQALKEVEDYQHANAINTLSFLADYIIKEES